MERPHAKPMLWMQVEAGNDPSLGWNQVTKFIESSTAGRNHFRIEHLANEEPGDQQLSDIGQMNLRIFKELWNVLASPNMD